MINSEILTTLNTVHELVVSAQDGCLDALRTIEALRCKLTVQEQPASERLLAGFGNVSRAIDATATAASLPEITAQQAIHAAFNILWNRINTVV